VLQNHGVARHQNRGDAPQNLPEWKIPRHDGKNGTQRLILNMSLLELQLFIGKERLGMLGIKIAIAGTLLDFGKSLPDRLSHFERHGFCDLVRFFSQLSRDRAKMLCTFGIRCRLPFFLRNANVDKNFFGLAVRVAGIGGDFLSSRRIDDDEGRRGFFLCDY
jgi:hypothetical protein